MDDRNRDLAAYAHGVGASSALPQLCRILAEKGLLTGAEIETLRHSAVLGFDMLRERKELSTEENEALDKGRGHLDNMWHRAALAAEDPKPPRA